MEFSNSMSKGKMSLWLLEIYLSNGKFNFHGIRTVDWRSEEKVNTWQKYTRVALTSWCFYYILCFHQKNLISEMFVVMSAIVLKSGYQAENLLFGKHSKRNLLNSCLKKKLFTIHSFLVNSLIEKFAVTFS